MYSYGYIILVVLCFTSDRLAHNENNSYIRHWEETIFIYVYIIIIIIQRVGGTSCYILLLLYTRVRYLGTWWLVPI